MEPEKFEIINYALKQGAFDTFFGTYDPNLLLSLCTDKEPFWSKHFESFMENGLPHQKSLLERFCDEDQSRGFRNDWRHKQDDGGVKWINAGDYDLDMAILDVLAEYRGCLNVVREGRQSWNYSTRLLTSIRYADGLRRFSVEKDVKLSDGISVLDAFNDCYNAMLEGATKYEEESSDQNRTYCAAFVFAKLHHGIENRQLAERVRSMYERSKAEEPSKFEKALKGWES